MSTVRQALAEAIQRREASRAKRDDSKAAIERASALLRHAEAAVEAFAGVDTALAQHRAAEIRAGADVLTRLPVDLQRQRAAREQAKEELGGAQAAHTLLSGELKDADVALIAAEQAVRLAAEAVLVDEAEPIARELQQARDTVYRCEDALFSLAHLWPSGITRPVALPQSIVDAIHATQRPQRAGNVSSGQAVEAHRWQSFFKSLCADASAETSR